MVTINPESIPMEHGRGGEKRKYFGLNRRLRIVGIFRGKSDFGEIIYRMIAFF